MDTPKSAAIQVFATSTLPPLLALEMRAELTSLFRPGWKKGGEERAESCILPSYYSRSQVLKLTRLFRS